MTLGHQKILSAAILTLFVLVTLQILVVLVGGGYDVSLGKSHLSAHRTGNLFVIQILLAVVLWLIFSREETRPEIRNPFVPGQEKRFLLAAFIAIAVLAGLAYHQIISGYFLSDDFDYLRLFGQAKVLNADILFGYLKGFGLLRPWSILSLWGDFTIWHLHPLGYHLTSLALHLLNAFLLLLTLLLLSRDKIFSFCGALLFSLYPLHPEAVAWISGRFDVLCATFYLLAVVLFFWPREKARGSLPLSILSLVSFLAALLSKEMAISLPLFLIVTDLLLPNERGSLPLKTRLKKHVPFWLLGLGYVAVRLVFFKGVGGYTPSQGSAFFSSWSFLDIRDIILRPFPALFMPLNASLYPHLPTLKNALLIILAIAILMIPFRKKLNFRLLIYGFCIIPLMALPALKIFFVSPTLEGARFLYLPSIGACIIIVTWAKSLGEGRSWKKIAMFLPVLLFFLLLVKNNTVWKSASEISERMTHQALTLLNDAEIQETLYVSGLPDNYGGAYIFRNGFSSAINILRAKKPLMLIDMNRLTSDQTPRGPGHLILEWKMDRFRLYRTSSSDSSNHGPEGKKDPEFR
jgi:hypothetical protein